RGRRRSVLVHVSLHFCLRLACVTRASALLLYPWMAIAPGYYYGAVTLCPSPWLVLPWVTAPLIYLLIQIGICGGIGNFIGTYRTYASLQQTLEYTVHYEKGQWFRYLLDFLAIAQVVFIAGLIGCFAGAEHPIRHGRNLAL